MAKKTSEAQAKAARPEPKTTQAARDLMKLGRAIKWYRFKVMGLSQTELGAMSGCAQSQVSAAEHGSYTINKLLALLRVLDIGIFELMARYEEHLAAQGGVDEDEDS